VTRHWDLRQQILLFDLAYSLSQKEPVSGVVAQESAACIVWIENSFRLPFLSVRATKCTSSDSLPKLQSIALIVLLQRIVERFVSSAHRDAEARDLPTGTLIRPKLAHFEELTGGFELAEVVRRYWEGHAAGDEARSKNALKTTIAPQRPFAPPRSNWGSTSAMWSA